MSAPRNRRLWIVPRNDGEALEIAKLLSLHGEDHLVTGQPWGATWSSLEPAIVAVLAALPEDVKVYGVELAGPNPWGAIDIDHHTYDGDDRSHPLSSLEQVAGILGIKLDRWQQLVAANDRAYIPGLEEAGAHTDEIEKVRAQDRAAQGLTDGQRMQAVADIAGAEWRGSRVAVTCPEGTSSWHSDLLYPIASEWLLMGPSSWSYSGPRHKEFAALGLPGSWSGGSPTSGYFGIPSPGPSVAQQLIERFFAEQQKER